MVLYCCKFRRTTPVMQIQAATVAAEAVDNFTDGLFLVTIDKLAVCTINYCDGMTSQKNFREIQVQSFAPACRLLLFLCSQIYTSLLPHI